MINRDNFEMFCMRCADGDLSPAELEALHTFLAVHPDLQEEWEVWQQLKLPVAESSMPGKELLLKKEPAYLSEEQAWLFIDEELNAEEQLVLQQLMENNVGAAQMVKELRAYVLEAPAIPCPNKEALLRTEKLPRVIWIQRISRFAAAAVIIGLILQFALSPNQGISDKAGTVEKTTLVNQETKNTETGHPLPPGKSYDVDELTAAVQAEKIPADQPISVPSAGITSPLKEGEEQARPQEITAQVPPESQVPSLTTSPTPPSAETIAVINTSVAAGEVTAAPIAKQIIYKELDTESDRNTITIGTMELREGRARGVWRKLGALLKSPTDRTNNNGIATQQPL